MKDQKIEFWNNLPVMHPNNIAEVLGHLGISVMPPKEIWPDSNVWLHDPSAGEDEIKKRSMEWNRFGPNLMVAVHDDGNYFIPRSDRRFVKVVPKPDKGMIICVAECVKESGSGDEPGGVIYLNIMSEHQKENESELEAATRGWRRETLTDLRNPELIGSFSRDGGLTPIVTGEVAFIEGLERSPKERARPFAVRCKHWRKIVLTLGAASKGKPGVHVDVAAVTLLAFNYFGRL